MSKMAYTVLYHPDVKKIDLPKLDNRIKNSIREAIERRLSTKPHLYGKPLQRTLKGYWKLRVGTYRIIIKISHENIITLASCGVAIIRKVKMYDRPPYCLD